MGLGSDALHLMSVVAPLNIVDNFSNASVCQPGKQLLSWRSFWMAWMRCSATHLVSSMGDSTGSWQCWGITWPGQKYLCLLWMGQRIASIYVVLGCRRDIEGV